MVEEENVVKDVPKEKKAKLNKEGLNDLHPDISPDSDQISIEAFMTFITERLKIDIPHTYQDPIAFNRFVQHRFMNYRQHSPLNINQTLE